ncbi:uncharacterized protein LOC144256908 [Urocitellus parryii]
MESRRSRHRKCLYCPPHSLPVAGMEPIGGLSPGTCAGGRPGGEERDTCGSPGSDPTPTPTSACRWFRPRPRSGLSSGALAGPARRADDQGSSLPPSYYSDPRALADIM